MAAARLGFAARCAALSGFVVGLALAPQLGDPAAARPLLGLAAAALPALALVGSSAAAAGHWRAWSPGLCAWLALVFAAAAAAGIAIGAARVQAIDAGALELAPGSRVELEGFVAAVPKRSPGEVDVRVDTPAGRLLVEAPDRGADLDVGAAIAATGTIRRPAEFERGYLERLGISRVLAATAIRPVDRRRGGLIGAFDKVRLRAQRALSAGTPEPAAALLRGFVLGQDDRIEGTTVDQFKRSGLAHLLAVSGQNVVLLAILAAGALALVGVGHRPRLVCILGLIAVYVVVTGAGPSIQRAGVMGAAGIVAALAGRPRSRWYALGLAAGVTLALDPRAVADVGWQLSFAAVAGILVFSAPLGRLAAGPSPGRVRRAAAEVVALTTAATIATAPLMSFHFGTVSLVSLPANVTAVIAEAPVMWLGMIAAAIGQQPWVPVEPITWLAGMLAAYIAQVAEWFAAPRWAQVELALPGPAALLGAHLLLCGALGMALRFAARRRSLRPSPARLGRRRAGRLALLAGAIALAFAPAVTRPSPHPRPGLVGGPGLSISVLDVGQGDSILLEPADGDPILVDAGPAGAVVADRLVDRGIGRLAALVITHPDSDHSGGAAAVIGSPGARHLLFAGADRATLAAASAAPMTLDRVAAGARLRSGSLRLRVLWPDRAAIRARVPGSEPNAVALVLLARWHGFRALLTGDAEAELAPVHPGDLDLLKVAHHGSADAGLSALLAETEPDVAVISVGEGNPYGHPSPATVAALEQAGADVLRTDTGGEISVAVGRHGWVAEAGRSDQASQ